MKRPFSCLSTHSQADSLPLEGQRQSESTQPLRKRACPSPYAVADAVADAASNVASEVPLPLPLVPPRRVRFEPSIRYGQAATITPEDVSAVWYSGLELVQIKYESTQLARRLLTANADARDPWLEHLNQVYGVFLQTKCEKDLQENNFVAVLAASSPRNASSTSLLNEACYGLEKWTIPSVLRETVRRRHFLTKQLLTEHQKGHGCSSSVSSGTQQQQACRNKLAAADRIRRLSRRTTLPARFMARYLALSVAASNTAETAASSPKAVVVC
jgi:hypothetical protein